MKIFFVVVVVIVAVVVIVIDYTTTINPSLPSPITYPSVLSYWHTTSTAVKFFA